MDIPLFERLFEQKLITGDELKSIRHQQDQPVSVHWELRTLLYLGILLFTTAAGILIYQNIDTIGHQVILVIIGAACLACLVYCFKKAGGYSHKRIESPGIWFDYVLLLGCLLFLTFIGYMQYQYGIFGARWGLATFIPMVFLFIAAYYFDHLGVLSLAITNLAAWAGIAITPLRILKGNDFSDLQLIYTGLVLGTSLLAVSFLVQRKNIKAHFAFTYKNFGAHILFISLLAITFYFDDSYLLWFLLLAGVVAFFIKNAIDSSSFYFLVIAILYGYTGLSYVVVKLLMIMTFDIGLLYLCIIYFIASGIALIKLFIYYNRILKKKDAGLP